MKIKLNVLLLILVGMSLQNCKENVVDNTRIENASPKIGLATGNKWEYDFTIYDFDSKVRRTLNFYTKVVGDTSIGGNQYSLICEDTLDTSNKVTSIVKENDVGYLRRTKYQYGTANEKRDTDIVIFKYPATVNTLYTVNPVFYPEFNRIFSDTMRITSLNSVVTVPAGTFICYKYVLMQNYYAKDSLNNIVVTPNFLTVYYVSDKGIIKQEFYFPNTENGIPFLAGFVALKNIKLNKK